MLQQFTDRTTVILHTVLARFHSPYLTTESYEKYNPQKPIKMCRNLWWPTKAYKLYPYLLRFEYPNKYLNNLKCFHAYTHDKDMKDKADEKDP
jgi:hypothetical protein